LLGVQLDPGRGVVMMTVPEDRVCIGVSRWKAGAGAGFLGLFAVIGTSRALSGHSATGLAIVLVLLGVPAAFYVRDTLRRGPSLVLDRDALHEVGSGRVVRWHDVEEVCARRRQGLFNEYHELVLTTRGGDQPPIEVSLDQLSMNWERIVSLVEERLGRAVPVRREQR
jgi:hypothetical protein